MRILLTIICVFMAVPVYLYAQNDFKTLDKQTYDYYLKGDYKNLKKTAESMLSQGIDYYYLRMRLGILAYNKQLYSIALRHFSRALDFSSSDTISREYIYYSYLLSGRKADANFYIESIPRDKKNSELKSIDTHGLSDIFAGSSVSGYDVTLYGSNNLYYEAVKSSFSLNAGFESNFSGRFKGTLAFTNYHKKERVYSGSVPSGKDIDFSQNQVYVRMTGLVFPGWEISGFGHVAFLQDLLSNNQYRTEYLGGVGILKNGWKIRTGTNFSLSNFSLSNQIRGEIYLTFLPYGNLNLYLSSGWMGQTDKNWGSTYQINMEIGFKVLKFLWIESGIIKGNSFLYGRDQGYVINNSFQIPATVIYGNVIILPGKKINIKLSPFYTEYENYSWNLNTYTRTWKLTPGSFGGAIKLTYINK